MSFNELEFVEWISHHAPGSPLLRQGIGDDMACLCIGGEEILLSSDMLLDGIHFDSRTQPMERIGQKALACSLSDCAAMAVRPCTATISVAFPSALSLDDAQCLFRGIFSLAEKFDVAIAGGDTTRGSASLSIDVAVVATPWKGLRPVLRSEARAGDRLYVTGCLGGSSAGKHLRFVPRVAEAKSIAESLGSRLHAMIDITDGLSLDLWRVCKASRVGARLDEESLERVISQDAKSMAAVERVAPLWHALQDGEDFELLLAVDGEAEVQTCPLFEIGVVKESGFELKRRDGTIETLEPRGFVH